MSQKDGYYLKKLESGESLKILTMLRSKQRREKIVKCLWK